MYIDFDIVIALLIFFLSAIFFSGILHCVLAILFYGLSVLLVYTEF